MKQAALKGKLIIQAKLMVKTGLHIGGSSDFAPIGAVDSPFIRDPLTHQPIIPGSSLKGKMRTLLSKIRATGDVLPADPAGDDPVVKRLFGASEKESAQPARLQFSDCFVSKDSEVRFEKLDLDTYLGEIKSENTINRVSGVATPRQIERVPAGLVFHFSLVYNVENEAELSEDMKALAAAFRLLQADYLGGHGSRGYGRVAFSEFSVKKMTFADGYEESEEPELEKKLNEAAL